MAKAQKKAAKAQKKAIWEPPPKEVQLKWPISHQSDFPGWPGINAPLGKDAAKSRKAWFQPPFVPETFLCAAKRSEHLEPFFYRVGAGA